MRSVDSPNARAGVGQSILASILFFGLFYMTGAFILAARLDLLRSLPQGQTVTFFAVAAAAYVFSFVLALLFRFESQSAPGRAGLLMERVAPSTGLRAVEVTSLVLSALAMLGSLWLDARFLPLALAAAIPVLLSLSVPVQQRPVGGGRTIVVPPGVPDPNLVPLPDTTQPLPEGYELVRYSWSYRAGLGSAEEFVAEIPVNIGLYEDFCRNNEKQAVRHSDDRYRGYAVRGITSEVRRLAEILRSLAAARGYGTLDEIGLAYSFVQDQTNISYSLDIETKGQEEYWRYPLETLYERTGDCECKAILLASVLLTMDYRVVAIEVPPGGSGGDGHVALGVEAPKGVAGNFVPYGGRQYFYLETTALGWQLGELPPDVDPRGVTIHPLLAHA